MSEMLRRVAEAIDPGVFEPPVCKCNDCARSSANSGRAALNQARRVIEAIREPTEEMLHAAMLTAVHENKGIEYAPLAGWRAMIDEALK